MSELVRHFDVAVIGAGPAGSAAAYHLARRGRGVVLLERAAFPRDKACGDGVGPRSVALLAEMGLDRALATYQRISGARIVARDGGRCDMKFHGGTGGLGSGFVIPRTELDALIVRRAVQAGAELWQQAAVSDLIVGPDRVRGVKVHQQHAETHITASFIVAADGANSWFARRVGLLEDRWSRGFAVRGYYTNISGADDLLSFYAPLADPEGIRTLSGYGWVFPLGEGRANIGVGFIPIHPQDFDVNLRRVFARFVEDLRRDRRFADMELGGPLRGAPVPCGLNPARCSGRGFLLVGDAAGLVDPFNGEGIDTALESGKLAAQVLEDALASPRPTQADLREYHRLLEERYSDRFQAGWEFVRRGFLWRLLDSTLEIQRPLFDSVRRTVFYYGAGGDANGRGPAGDSGRLPQTIVTAAVSKMRSRLAAVIQSEFPLLFKICSHLMDPTRSAVRTNLVFLAGRFGRLPQSRGIAAAAAVELAWLALTMHSNVLVESAAKCQASASPRAPRGSHWGNTFAIMTGDYLLAKAYGLAALLGVEACQRVSQAMAEVYAGKLQESNWSRRLDVKEDRYLAVMEKKVATFYELPCHLGALAGEAPPEIVRRLANYGRNLGMAFALTDELLAILADGEDPLEHPVASILEDGAYSWPILSALRSEDRRRLTVLLRRAEVSGEQIRSTLAILRDGTTAARVRLAARSYADRAKRCLVTLPSIPARRTLSALADFVVDRVTESR